MSQRQPRRSRRRLTPASALPRPQQSEPGLGGGEPDPADGAARSSARRPAAAPSSRTHHVTNDYSYVRRDLASVVGVGIVVVGFIVGMAFVVS